MWSSPNSSKVSILLVWLVVACGARTGLDVDGRSGTRDGGDGADNVAPETDGIAPRSPGCGSTGRCTSTRSRHTGALGGRAGADAICDAEIPGSHFYRQSCDRGRGFLGTTSAGFAELELGDCWNCNGWTADDSGPYSPSTIVCETGYATVGAALPSLCVQENGPCWRICEAGDYPLVCCWP